MNRELGMILTATGPLLKERAFWYREMAALVQEDCPETARFLSMQADRMDEVILQVARQMEPGFRQKT